MFSIKDTVTNKIIIKNSTFITYICYVDDISEVKRILSNIRDEYKNATHYCYGYIIDNKEKCSDDKEPSGTAGLPILNVLKKQELTNILCIVVRYYGGIKLGAGGLTRAYSNSVSESLKLCNIKEYFDYHTYEFNTNYEIFNDIESFIKDYIILINYTEGVIGTLKIPENKVEDIIYILNKYHILYKKIVK